MATQAATFRETKEMLPPPPPPPPPLGCLHLETPRPHHLHPPMVVPMLSLEVAAMQGLKPLPLAPGGWGCSKWHPGVLGDKAGVRPHGTTPP